MSCHVREIESIDWGTQGRERGVLVIGYPRSQRIPSLKGNTCIQLQHFYDSAAPLDELSLSLPLPTCLAAERWWTPVCVNSFALVVEFVTVSGWHFFLYYVS